MTIHGVDISNYQASWKPASNDRFVFIKATEGRTYASPARSSQAAAARDRDLQVGFYHFLHPGNIEDQAKYFVEKAPFKDGDLLVCDWEFSGTSNTDKDNFIKAVKKLAPRNKVGLYCNTSWWKTVDKTSYCGDFLWIANYNKAHGVTHEVKFWQYSDKPIDQNTGYFDSLDELKAWARELIQVVVPKPTPTPSPVPSDGGTVTPTPTTPTPETPIVVSEKVEVIAGGKITSPYGYKATNPATGRSYWAAGKHPGDDWNKEPQDLGLPVCSAVSGKVVHAGTGGWGSAYGKHVIVESSDKRRTAHCHLSSVTVKKNQIVKAGQQLGKVGSTGNVTGPHCHVERRRSPFTYNIIFEKPVYETVRKVVTPWDGKSFPGADAFYLGAKGDYITLLGKRLVVHGWKGYSSGPGPTFTDVDQDAVAWVQKKQGFTGAAADGIPGLKTWIYLMADPVVVVVPPPTPKPVPGFKLVAELDAPSNGAWQGAAIDNSNGRFYLAHSLGNGEGRVYEFGVSDSIVKPYLSTMKFKALTHVYGFGIDNGDVWVPWDAKDGNDVTKIKFAAGKTVKKSDAQKLHVFSEHPTQITFSQDRKSLVAWETVGKNYRFTKRLTDDILKNVNRPQGKSIVIPKPSTTWLQGFSTHEDYLYVAWGKTEAKSWIDKYSVITGKKVATLDVTSSGFLAGESRTGAGVELEGMDGLMFTRKVFRNDARKLRVYELINF